MVRWMNYLISLVGFINFIRVLMNECMNIMNVSVCSMCLLAVLVLMSTVILRLSMWHQLITVLQSFSNVAHYLNGMNIWPQQCQTVGPLTKAHYPLTISD